MEGRVLLIALVLVLLLLLMSFGGISPNAQSRSHKTFSNSSTVKILKNGKRNRNKTAGN